MTIEHLKTIPLGYGVEPKRVSWAEFVRWFQRREGNTDCYLRAADGQCEQMECLWRLDCLAFARQGRAFDSSAGTADRS